MDRRHFLGSSAAVSGLLLLKSKTAFGYGANSAVRLALLGCGSRGTEVAVSMAKNTSARIVALGDLFEDQLERGEEENFDAVNMSLGIPSIDPRLLFRGYKAYEEVVASSEVDAVQISTPPWFHVQHLDAAVKAGKHVYCEKPLGVDVAQAMQAVEIGKRAEGRVSLEIGFEVRNAPPIAEIVRRIHEGALGKIASITAYYNAPEAVNHTGTEWSPDEFQIRNWLWYRNLSGDILVEQNIHVIDICNWILNSHPVKAFATGGRNVINHAGDNWDNYQVTYTYADNVHLSFSSTQFGKNHWYDVSERIFGSDGIAEAPYSGPVRIIGENPWAWSDASSAQSKSPAAFAANGAFTDNLEFADQEKVKSFIGSITSGKFHNQTVQGVESALTCMLGRMAGELGREVTWEEQLKHGEQYSMNIDMSQFK